MYIPHLTALFLVFSLQTLSAQETEKKIISSFYQKAYACHETDPTEAMRLLDTCTFYSKKISDKNSAFYSDLLRYSIYRDARNFTMLDSMEVKMNEAVPEVKKEGACFYFIGVGDRYNTTRRYTTALEYYERAYALLDSTFKEFFVLKKGTLEKLGQVQSIRNHYVEAIDWLGKYETHLNNGGSKARKADFIALYEEYADLFSKMEDYKRSLEYLEKAERFAEKDKEKGRLALNKANRYIDLKAYDKALELLHGIEANTGKMALSTQIRTKLALGNAYRFKGNWEKALQYIKKGEKQRFEHNFDDLEGNFQFAQGKCLQAMGQYTEALTYLQRAETKFEAYPEFINAQLETKEAIIQCKAELAGVDKKSEFSEYLQLQDSLEKRKIEMSNTELLEKYHTAQKEKENAQLLAENQLRDKTISAQRNYLILGGLAFLTISLLSYFLFRQNKRRLKIQKSVEKQRDQILLLHRELNHRVKNNLALIASLLEMQNRRADKQEVKDALSESELRIRAMSLVHNDLFTDHDSSAINLADYLQSICLNLQKIFEAPGQTLDLQMRFQKFRLDADDAMRIGIIVNELMTNSVKHAFADVASPFIHIETALNAEGHLLLKYEDNGPGVTEQVIANATNQNSLGVKLIKLLTDQMHGTITHSGKSVEIRMQKPVAITVGA